MTKLIILIFIMTVGPTDLLHAKETKGSTYQLGRSGPMAGFIPGPGVYMRNDIYYYSGESDDMLNWPDEYFQDIESSALVDVLGISWITDLEILGGAFGVGVGIAYGQQEFSAYIGHPSPFFPDQTIEDDNQDFWDPGVGFVLGWHEESHHWQVSTGITIPTGRYEEDKYSSIPKNRWVFDLSAGYTYFSLDSGYEASALLGFSIPTENPDSDFTPGSQTHVELAAFKHFPSHLSVGVVGYYLQQITEDTGKESDDRLSRVAGLGPSVGYFFSFLDRNYSLNLRVYHEFLGEYRLEGDAFFCSLGVAL